MLYQLSYFRFFRFFRAIPSLDFVFSVSHYREVTPSLVARPPRTHSEINFKNLCCFPGDFCVRLRLNLWEKMDSNHRRYKPADLQSAPFGHSGILLSFLFGDNFVRLHFVAPHNLKVAASLLICLPCSPRKINFKNLLLFPDDSLLLGFNPEQNKLQNLCPSKNF